MAKSYFKIAWRNIRRPPMAIRKELSGLEAVSGFSIFYYAKVIIPNGGKPAMEFERPQTGTGLTVRSLQILHISDF